jgi:complex iron-sulfur molybdoenzyme family reductase subunit gamma
MADADGPALTIAALAILIALSAVLAPTADARPAHEIPVAPATGNLSAPTGGGWADVPASTVPLTSAPSSVPNADDTSIDRVMVQAARGDGTLYLRLQYHDATRDVNTSSPRSFADAAAVQFPVNTSSRPPIAMGGQDNPVNVWYWEGSVGGQELLAGGAGTTTGFGEQTMSAQAVHRGSGSNATWTVLYQRDLTVAGDNRTSVPEERDLDVAFAVWNGSNGERSGQKSISEWHYFPFGEGPSGPPYETLLWSIAGIAIVAVIAVTAYGVRRTGGGGG